MQITAHESKTKEQPKLIDLSVRLLRSGTTVEDALRHDHGLSEMSSQIGRLFIGQSPALPPTWASYLSDISAEANTQLRNQSCSAILFVQETTSKTNRLFAFCFGQGHHALNSDRLERRFGLRAVLNSVTRGGLRTLDSATLDSTVMQRRVQASRVTDLQAFGIDTDRDLLRLASGTPTAITIAKAMSGKDALHIRAQIRALDLVQYCNKLIALYRSKNYQTDFSFIDHIIPVENASQLAALDQIAFAEIKKLIQDQPSDIHLAIPDILSPESNIEIGYYGSGLPQGAKQTYSEIAIEDYIAELQKGNPTQISDMPSLKASHEIRVVANGEGDRSHKRKLYNCLVHETVLSGKTHVLFDGQWYLINDKYFNEIESYYTQLLHTPFLKHTSSKNEKELISELENHQNMLCLDETKSSPTGAPTAAIEICDFFTTEKQFIHLKDGHSSAPLSHLWNQALVATEAFVRDEAFRKAVRKAIKSRQAHYHRDGFLELVPTPPKKPISAEYKVIFGVMRHKYRRSNSLGLPFFSKVALKAAASRISLMGFGVELHLIEKV